MQSQKLQIQLGESKAAFPRIVLSRDDVLIPYNFLSWIQRHLIQLLNLRDAAFVARHLREGNSGVTVEHE